MDRVEHVTPALCPKCGNRYHSIWISERGNRTYVYAIHGRRKCYLGPLDEYVYVTRLHEREGLALKGAFNARRIGEWALPILGVAVLTEEGLSVDEEFASRLVAELRSLADQIEREIKEYKEAEKRGELERLEREWKEKHAELEEEWHLVEVAEQLEDALKGNSGGGGNGMG